MDRHLGPRRAKKVERVDCNEGNAVSSTTLGFLTQEHMKDDALSPFNASTDLVPRMQALPTASRPTKTQCEVPHHPWIDLIPLPRMRENLLRAGGAFDDMELCGELDGMFSDSSGTAGMIVWGEPWNLSDWEVTETFVKRWGWTIEGCWEVFESTNHWRHVETRRIVYRWLDTSDYSLDLRTSD